MRLIKLLDPEVKL